MPDRMEFLVRDPERLKDPFPIVRYLRISAIHSGGGGEYKVAVFEFPLAKPQVFQLGFFSPLLQFLQNAFGNRDIPV